MVSQTRFPKNVPQAFTGVSRMILSCLPQRWTAVQFDCGSVPGWKIGGPARILRLMDDPAIKLYPDKNSGAWNWELLLRGKRIAYGEFSDTQEAAYTAARQALVKERERRSKR
jgi:hypothetical protein